MQILLSGQTPLKRRSIFAIPCLLLGGFVSAPNGHTNAAGDPHMKRGLQLSQQKKWTQAEAEFRKAIALDPKNALYKSYLADALAAQGKFGQAQSSYQQSDRITKEQPQPRVTRANSDKVKGAGTRSGGGRPSASRITTPSTTSQTASSGGGTGRTLPPGVFVLPDGSKVTVTGRTGTTPPPRDSSAGAVHDTEGAADVIYDPHYLKGQKYIEDEKWTQAAAEFRAVLKIFPRSPEAWDALGDVYFKQGNWQEAEKAHRASLRLEPTDGYYHAQVAYDLLKQGRREEALKAAHQARRLGLEDHLVFEESGLSGRLH